VPTGWPAGQDQNSIDQRREPLQRNRSVLR
jgi:hypothetical protein